jgi:hypothetical protein
MVAASAARAIRLDRSDPAGAEAIAATIARRMDAALSEIPAERVESAEWLIRESGTDAPSAVDLLVAAAKEGIRNLGRERAWADATAARYEARLVVAFEGPLRRASVADEEKSVER